jgi:hypothetical protein
VAAQASGYWNDLGGMKRIAIDTLLMSRNIIAREFMSDVEQWRAAFEAARSDSEAE